MPTTKEGLLWTPDSITNGLETEAVLSDSPSIKDAYDVIVIGAGFAGLVAARDLSQIYGKKVLIIEGRDRIGGRTWTANFEGGTFEMGGNWVHWLQPHTWTELVRYGLDRHLVQTRGSTEDAKLYWCGQPGKTEAVGDMSIMHDINELADKFFNIEGNSCRDLMPFPLDTLAETGFWKKYDHLSVRDRLEQLQDVPEQLQHLWESIAAGVGLAPATKIGFTDMLKWYALSGHDMHKLADLSGRYKIGNDGMTTFAKLMFEDYKGDIILNSVVKEIKQQQDRGGMVVSVTGHGDIQADKVVCTVPLNCLSDVIFTPALSDIRTEAAKAGQVNYGSKFHVKLSTAEEPWAVTSKIAPPGLPFNSCVQDRNTEDYKSQWAVAFGTTGAVPSPAVSKENADGFINMYKSTFNRPGSEAEPVAYLTHDWAIDPMSKGAWACLGPDGYSKYLEELQKDHGDVVFASADWAVGGIGFVDGAIEQGKQAARRIGTGVL